MIKYKRILPLDVNVLHRIDNTVLSIVYTAKSLYKSGITFVGLTTNVCEYEYVGLK